ncbi:MAG TPA: sugar nucleotide-binding protein, partial [Thermoanaerobaculia bacterium]|nr:sugar nucleotide-binding protein [Thermoanaerobaculia bacterium]
GEVTWSDFAQEILVLSGHLGIEVEPIDSVSLGRPARRPAQSLLDTSKYGRLTGRAIRHFREPLVEYLTARARPEA